jgi:hypothetical protein
MSDTVSAKSIWMPQGSTNIPPLDHNVQGILWQMLQVWVVRRSYTTVTISC